MPQAALTEADVQVIVDEFERGATRVDLAARYRVHPNTITRALRRSGAASRLGPKRALDGTGERRLVEAYRRGVPTTEIASELGISAAHVSRVALTNGETARRPNLPGRPQRINAEIALVVGCEYRAGASVHDLASRHRVSPTTGLRTLVRLGVDRRARWAAK